MVIQKTRWTLFRSTFASCPLNVLLMLGEDQGPEVVMQMMLLGGDCKEEMGQLRISTRSLPHQLHTSFVPSLATISPHKGTTCYFPPTDSVVVQLKDNMKDHLNDHINFSTSFKSDSFEGIIIQMNSNSLNKKKLYSQCESTSPIETWLNLIYFLGSFSNYYSEFSS